MKGSGHFRLDATAGEHLIVTVQLPAQAPVALTTSTVNFSNDDPAVGDGDAACGGSDTAPIPAAGKVCIYVSAAELPENVTAGSAQGDRVPDGTSGFTIGWDATAAAPIRKTSFFMNTPLLNHTTGFGRLTIR